MDRLVDDLWAEIAYLSNRPLAPATLTINKNTLKTALEALRKRHLARLDDLPHLKKTETQLTLSWHGIAVKDENNR